MKKRFFYISSLVILIISTAVVYWLSNRYQKEIAIEERRMRRYITSSASLALSIFQDEIIFSFYSLSAKIHNNDLNKILEEENFPAYMESYGEIFTFAYLIENDDIPQYNPLWGNRVEQQKSLEYLQEVLTHFEQDQKDIIFIKNLKGYMVFPSGNDFLFLGISLTQSLWKNLLHTVRNKFLENRIADSRDSDDFDFFLLFGKDVLKGDLIIDLNQFFNIRRIETFFNRSGNNQLPIVTSNAYVDDHLYLVMSHQEGSIDKVFQEKYSRFFIMEIFIAFLILITVQLLAMLYYSAHRNYKKEHEFMSLISHELNTPLSIISLSAENLMEELFSEEKGIAYYGELIKRESLRLKKMINNILLLTNHSYKISYCDFAIEKIDEILLDLKKKCTEVLEIYKAILEIQDQSRVREIFCCRHLLVIAIFNIIDNCIRYGAAHASEKLIILNLTNMNKNGITIINFRIRDFGPGIPSHESKKIFNNFYRGKSVKEQQIPGSGLGLSLSRNIVREHRGSVNLLNHLEAGALFQVWLPAGEY